MAVEGRLSRILSKFFVSLFLDVFCRCVDWCYSILVLTCFFGGFCNPLF